MKPVQPVPPFKLVNKNAEVEVSDVFPNKQFVQLECSLAVLVFGWPTGPTGIPSGSLYSCTIKQTNCR